MISHGLKFVWSRFFAKTILDAKGIVRMHKQFDIFTAMKIILIKEATPVLLFKFSKTFLDMLS